MNYILHTDKDRQDMLDTLSIKSVDELFAGVEPRLQRPLNLPPALSEMELQQHLSGLAGRNKPLLSFRGAGSYAHYSPAAINHLILRGEFYTAYTPYQPEVSQGTLQMIYEFQTLICQLTGMDAANASMYDGATALAESMLMARAISGKNEIVIANPLHPLYRSVLETYAAASGLVLSGKIGPNTAAIIVQQPNYHGTIEDLSVYAKAAKDAGALFVVSVSDPTSLAIIKPPGEFGADVVVGDLQALGNGMNYGGPTGGFMAVKNDYLKRIPGRLCGLTTDNRGQQGFVLTLQAREQHIRREKATSNICTNQSLNALIATIYLALMGATGLKRVAASSYHRAHQLQQRLEAMGLKRVNDGPFYNEFAVKSPVPVERLNAVLEEAGFLGGLELPGNQWLLCCTELLNEKDIEQFIQTIQPLMKEPLVKA